MRPWLVRLGWLVAASSVVLTGCSSGPGPAVATGEQPGRASTPPPSTLRSGPAAPATATVRPSSPTRPAFAGVIAAGGVRQWLSCAGPGRVTLLIIPGLRAPAADWSGVLAPLRRDVRTCVYDRPGLGRSPLPPAPRATVDAGELAAQLWAALHAAGEDGPYLVLGHSFGGLVARAFVAEHRAAVAGVLLAESVTPGDPTLPRFWTEAGHPVDLVASSAATGGGPALGGLPLVVVSASAPDRDHLGGPTYGQPAWMIRLWRQQQHDDLRLSTSSIQVVARAGHVVQQDDPRAVELAVRVLLDAVRSRARLGCSAAWSSVQATCR